MRIFFVKNLFVVKIYRDLKTQNVFLTKRDLIKIGKALCSLSGTRVDIGLLVNATPSDVQTIPGK